MPTTFKTNNNQPFTISITLRKLRTISERYGRDVFDPQQWQKLTTSFLEQATFVWYLIADQAEELGIDVDEFDESLEGSEASDALRDAFTEELASFYRRQGKEAMATMTEVQIESVKKAEKAVRDGDLKSLMSDQVDKLLAGSGLQS